MDQIVPTAIAVAVTGVTSQRFHQISAEGWFKPVSRGKWRLRDVLEGRQDLQTEDNAKRSRVAGESELKKARAREIELRIARQDRKVIDLDEAMTVLEEQAGEFLASLSGLPARITRLPRERQRIEAITDEERKRLAISF